MSVYSSPEIIPDGWRAATIGDVCKVVSGSTPKTSVSDYWGGAIPWLTPNDLSKNRSKVVVKGERSITQKGFDSCSTQMVPEGSVLFTSRAPIGYVAIAGAPMCTNQGFKSAVPSESIGTEFLYWQLQNLTEDIRSRASGTTFLEISGKGFASTKIVVPPLREQEKIVEILEEQISRLDAALASVRAAREKSARFRRSLLHAAFTGGLTGHEVSLGNSPQDWVKESVGDFASIKTGKIDVNAAVEDGAYPFFTCAREIYRINEAPYEGRVVLIAGNGDLNVKYYEGKFNAYQRTYFLTVVDETKLLPKYLFQFMEMYVEHLRKISIGTTIKYIKLGDLRDAIISIPPLAVQNEIVKNLEEQHSRLESALAIADAIEKKASALRRSLLHAAFTGELTKELREGANV